MERGHKISVADIIRNDLKFHASQSLSHQKCWRHTRNSCSIRHTHDERKSRALCPRKWYSWLIDTFIWINFRQIKIMLNDDRQQSCLVVPMVYFMAREGKREKRKKSWFRYLWTQKLNSLQTNINKAYQRGESNTYRSHSPLTYHLFGTHKFFVCFPPSLPWCESQHSSCSYQKFKEIACSFFRVWEKHVNIQAEKLSKILPNKTSSKKSPEKLYHAFFISFDSFFFFRIFFPFRFVGDERANVTDCQEGAAISREL